MNDDQLLAEISEAAGASEQFRVRRDQLIVRAIERNITLRRIAEASGLSFSGVAKVRDRLLSK